MKSLREAYFPTDRVPYPFGVARDEAARMIRGRRRDPRFAVWREAGEIRTIVVATPTIVFAIRNRAEAQ